MLTLTARVGQSGDRVTLGLNGHLDIAEARAVFRRDIPELIAKFAVVEVDLAGYTPAAGVRVGEEGRHTFSSFVAGHLLLLTHVSPALLPVWPVLLDSCGTAYRA
jgi:hypothetical protein